MRCDSVSRMRHWSPTVLGPLDAEETERAAVALAHAAPALSRGLPPILSLYHLAASAGVEYRVARAYAERADWARPYTIFRIRKRAGGLREIAVPSNELLRLQRWIHVSVLRVARPHGAAHAFCEGRGIRTMAAMHCRCRFLIKMDLRDFFGSLDEQRVTNLFHEFGYSKLVAFEMGRLCTYIPAHKKLDRASVPTDERLPYSRRTQGVLPQGGACSPALSNLLVRGVDSELVVAASRFGLTYSRYADDLVFSTSSREFSRVHAAAFVRVAHLILRSHALTVNHSKTRIAGPGARRLVVGLLVDRAVPRLTREFRNRVDMHIYCVDRLGLAAHARARGFSSDFGLLRYLRGLAAFAMDIDPEYGTRIRVALDTASARAGYA